MTLKEKELILAIHRIGFLKIHEKVLLKKHLNEATELNDWTLADVEQLVGRPIRTLGWDSGIYLKRAEEDMRFLHGPDTGILVWGDEAYPVLLAGIFDPPFLLYYRGTPWVEKKVKVAVVGTRFPSEEAKCAARILSRDLSSLGVEVVSGLAQGIDAHAHAGALETGGTWAVLGNGIDRIYPPGNRNLARMILNRGGGIFSEYGVGVEPRAFRFPARNRIVSGLCEVTVVIQAPRKSGALITAQSALDQGRDVMVHRLGLDSSKGDGGLDWAASGAPVIETAQEVLNCWKNGPPWGNI